eukprot:jgi/Chlat1/9019/Chrsp94S08295
MAAIVRRAASGGLQGALVRAAGGAGGAGGVRSKSQAAAAVQDGAVGQHQLGGFRPAQTKQAEDGDDRDVDVFAGVRTGELAAAYLNLALVGNPLAVSAGGVVVEAALRAPGLVSAPVFWALKHTTFAHFCAGETLEEARRTVRRLRELGMRSILDYAVEDAQDEATADRNLAGVLDAVRTAAALSNAADSPCSHACVKLTALAPADILERTSQVLRHVYSRPQLQPPPWMRPTLPVLVSGSTPELSSTQPPPPLTADEQRQLHNVHERLSAVCRECDRHGLSLLVDAEQSWVQPAIDYITYACMMEYNKKYSLVHTTIQAYLKDAKPRLEAAIQAAEAADVHYGVKLVRGAYLSAETQAAQDEGYASPIQDSITCTHENYDTCAAVLLHARSQPHTVLATHNPQSAHAAAALASALSISCTHPRLQFAQLKGMADGLSLSLAQKGYRVSKYLPYGPVKAVVPYLLRRAEENRAVLKSDDAVVMRRALWQRMTGWFHLA